MPDQFGAAQRASVYRWVLWQAIVAVLIALAWSAVSIKMAYSALLGGFICVIANAYFAYKILSCISAQASSRMVWNFYQGEMIKLLLTAGMFFLAIKYIDLAALPFFSAYLGVQLVLWIALLVESNRA